jgi:hypothetical protein
MNWKEHLLNQAKRYKMCKENFAALSACESKDEAVRLYIKTIDWALENNYPALRVLEAEFAEQEHNGIFVGKTFHGEEFSHLQTYVFHNCKGRINVAMDYENAIIPMFYFANGCDISITCEQDNIYPIKVPIYIFGDDNIVSAKNDDNAVFLKYKQDVL